MTEIIRNVPLTSILPYSLVMSCLRVSLCVPPTRPRTAICNDKLCRYVDISILNTRVKVSVEAGVLRKDIKRYLPGSFVKTLE
jgi:hypothetical protein